MEIFGCPFSANETVLRPTPALSAMSRWVGRRVSMGSTIDLRRADSTEKLKSELCYLNGNRGIFGPLHASDQQKATERAKARRYRNCRKKAQTRTQKRKELCKIKTRSDSRAEIELSIPPLFASEFVLFCGKILSFR